ncbi:MAG TPA: SDR family oxidoreductase [Candidatus Thermoplasmatota archaeon]|nr:SDR family oxidoreductase [Candidatus Thermoplasmatota archaeon]
MPARRVAWVTGAGRGIGRACALALAEAGHDVALSARTETELRSAADACRKYNARTVEAPCDVTDPARVAAAHASIVQQLGAPSVLVCAAGIARSAPFHKTTLEVMDQHWKLNVLGTFHCMQACLPSMAQQGWGRIINVASVAGKVGAPYIAAYAASKHAVLGLTRSVAAEVGPKGVTVNAVCPGYVNTPMTHDNLDRMAQTTGRDREELLARLRAFSPQNRLIEPEEVAAVVAHLARPESQGINGQAITIDGGAVQW